MKIILVHNPHDSSSKEKATAVAQRLTAKGRAAIVANLRERIDAGDAQAEIQLDAVNSQDQYTGEYHVIDFNLLRDVVPIRTAPCMLVLFDELEGGFPVERIISMIDAAKAAASVS